MDTTCKIIWTRKEVSSQLAVVGDLCYYVVVTDLFNAVEVRACNALTGKHDRVIYKEPNPERDLILWKTSNRTLYLQSIDPTSSALFRIKDLTLQPLYKNSRYQLPLGYVQDECVLTRQESSDPWIARGKPLSTWILPKQEIEHVSLHSGHVITIFEGSHTIWFCSPHKSPVRLFSIKAGDLLSFYWSDWESAVSTTLESYIVKSPFSIPQVIHIVDHTIVHNNPCSIKDNVFIKRPIRFKPLEVHRFHTISADGTKVPYILIHEKGVNLKALLVYVYGAYGSTSAIEWPYKTWYSLLQRRWAIVYALVRGGGDVTMNWANQGRRTNRHRSIDDFEAVITAAQQVTKITAKHTVIYGRSAGGIPVGAMVSRYPDGQLIGAAYTEVPYVDVLRTTTNPALPLTIGEYKEFGNPRENILDFAELLKVSPIDTLPADGAPGVFVLSRVGLLDRQVYPYESFKWIQRLRGNTEEVGVDPKGKYVMYDKEEAHKYDQARYIPTHATDMAILDAWVDGRLHI
jgi:hypothetical protein